jgi:hypothetical protein
MKQTLREWFWLVLLAAFLVTYYSWRLIFTPSERNSMIGKAILEFSETALFIPALIILMILVPIFLPALACWISKRKPNRVPMTDSD